MRLPVALFFALLLAAGSPASEARSEPQASGDESREARSEPTRGFASGEASGDESREARSEAAGRAESPASAARSEARGRAESPASAARSEAAGRAESPASAARSEAAGRAESPGWSEQVERELMSPYCPGRSLVECPSPQATELRLWIQAQERAGVPRESVEARLFQQFGDQLRHGPRAEGFGVFAYLVPAGALLAGLGLVLVFLRRQTRPVPAAPGAAPPRDSELERRLDEELGATS